MPYKFKVGDKVRTTTDADTDNGSITGTVTHQPDTENNYYRITRDDTNNSWECNVSETELITDAIPDSVVKVTFDSVILSDDKKLQITDAISQIDHYDKIFKEWGFGKIFEKGTAISLLLYGPPGTGKTLMAQAIADKYSKKLITISTAEIQTPEPGGAERALAKYFDEHPHDVLLFDECDSLIADRQRVGMIMAAQINALLTGLEKFKGIAIFTTNRLGVLDPAFDRRVSLKLEFPMPTPELRAKIWQRMFPKECPLEKDIDWTALAQIEIAGGHIKNVVLKAARRAAASGADKITSAVIWEALEQEVESLAAYKDALEQNNQWFGQALTTASAEIARERGRQVISRG